MGMVRRRLGTGVFSDPVEEWEHVDRYGEWAFGFGSRAREEDRLGSAPERFNGDHVGVGAGGTVGCAAEWEHCIGELSCGGGAAADC